MLLNRKQIAARDLHGLLRRYPELYMTLKRQACCPSLNPKRKVLFPSTVDDFVPQTQHDDLRIVYKDARSFT